MAQKDTKVLKVLRISQSKIWIVLAYLNINSFRNKFDRFPDEMKGNVDVLAILDTKLDDLFLARII